jgi:hypothetical protein
VRCLYLVGLLLTACQPATLGASGQAAATSQVSFEPPGDANGVPCVVHVHVSGVVEEPAAVGVFQGALSDYYLGRIKQGDIPAALQARQVPSVAWQTPSELVVAPSQALALGEQYSVASTHGLLAEFRVATISAPALTRLWPPTGAPSHAVYCAAADGTLSSLPISLLLEPGDTQVLAQAGVGVGSSFSSRCLWFDAPSVDAGAIVVPPPSAAGFALDPTPFTAGSPTPTSPITCTESELAIGLGCAAIDDDRVVLRTPTDPLLWAAQTAGASDVEITSAGRSLVIRGLAPARSGAIVGAVYDLAGNGRAFDVIVSTLPAHEHLVLNEVLANPLGPEPDSEWVELVNDGEIPISLGNYQFQDSGGAIALPAQELGVGQYVVLVNQSFASDGSDVPPAPGALVIRVPKLGTSGLANSGEALALIDGAGSVVSRVPALAAPAGKSIARRRPWALDDDPLAFSVGEPTPGLANGD